MSPYSRPVGATGSKKQSLVLVGNKRNEPAQNIAKLFNCSLRSSPEITVAIDSQGIDQLPVNQRVAGSSPADGAIFYACHKDVTVRVGG